MNQAGFAKLCGVSKPMVSKYVSMGLVVVDAGVVDVEDSLRLLEGRLDEGKRQQALAAWDQMSGIKTEPLARPIVKSRPKAGNSEVQSAKAQKDEVDLALKRLEYAQKAGLVVSVEDVQQRALEAVAAFREIVANSKREAAKKLCAKFDLPAEHETAVTKFLQEWSEEALGRFGAMCAGLAQPEGQTTPQINGQTPAMGELRA